MLPNKIPSKTAGLSSRQQLYKNVTEEQIAEARNILDNDIGNYKPTPTLNKENNDGDLVTQKDRPQQQQRVQAQEQEQEYEQEMEMC